MALVSSDLYRRPDFEFIIVVPGGKSGQKSHGYNSDLTGAKKQIVGQATNMKLRGSRQWLPIQWTRLLLSSRHTKDFDAFGRVLRFQEAIRNE